MSCPPLSQATWLAGHLLGWITYAAYVLADSAFARLDHGSTGVQHIRLN